MDDFDLAVFSLDPLREDDQMAALFEGKIQINYANKNTGSNSFKISYVLTLKQLRKFYKSFKPAIVHAHYASSYGLLGALLRHDNFLISVWGSDVNEFPKRSSFHKLVFKFILSKAHHIFSTSASMKLELANYTKKEVEVIPFGIDIIRFQHSEKHRSAAAPVIGTVKSLSHIYGIDRLLRVTQRLRSEFPSIRCVIYGKGPQEAALIALANELKIAECVEFRGFVNNRLLPEILPEFDVFCVLSRSESFGVAALEAQASAVPVVATHVGGLPEVVRDGVTGFLVPEDEAIIAAKIAELLRDPDLRKQMGKAARAFVETHFDWNEQVKRMKSIYQTC